MKRKTKESILKLFGSIFTGSISGIIAGLVVHYILNR